MILLRALVYQIAFLAWTAALGILGLPLLLGPRRAVMLFGTFWSAGTLAILKACCGLGYELRGREHLPAGAAIIAM